MIKISGGILQLFSVVVLLLLITFSPFILGVEIYDSDGIINRFPAIAFGVGSSGFIALFIALFVSFLMYLDDLEEINIKLPHFQIKEYLEKRKKVKEMRNKLQEAIFYAKTNEEIDILNNKLKSLNEN